MFRKEKYLSLFINNPIEALRYFSAEIPRSLFKFYALGNNMDEAKLKTLKEDKIWVELFKNQNDPFEMINLDIDERTVKPKYSKNGSLVINKDNLVAVYRNYMNSYKESIKTASFCDAMATNISMWAYYTNNHQGFCCEYELIDRDWNSMKCLRPVLYEKTTSQIKALFVEHLLISDVSAANSNPEVVRRQQFNNLEMIKLFASCKDESWSHEKEYRVLYFGEKSGTGEAVKCSDLNVKIKAIYSGIRCSQENKIILKRIAKELGVDFREMRASPTDYLLID